MRFDKLIIYSDVDGTASYTVGKKVQVSKENKEAINEFVKGGGLFSIASGRSPYSILKTFENVNINLPLVASNGAIVYDPLKDKKIFSEYVNDKAKTFIYDIVLNDKRLMMTAMDDNDTYKLITNDERDAKVLDFPRSLMSYDTLMQTKILKLAILALKEDVDSISEMINANASKYDLKSARSANIYLELYDLNAGKDVGIKKVLDSYQLNDRKLVCIGDQHNDIDMLKLADIAICPGNAVKEVKEICNYITCDCKYSAIKEAIDYLRRTDAGN